MPSWKTLGAGCLTILALIVASGGCMTSFVLFAQAMEQEARPNSALIVFALTVIVGSLLVVAARAVSKEPEELTIEPVKEPEELTEEPMKKPEFVDTHVHFYDMEHPELVYAHWAPDVDHPTLGTQMRKLGERNFVAEDYIEVTRPSNVVKAVHVQAAIGSPDPVKETEWLQEAADRTGFPHGIIAFADLSANDAEAVLAGHCEFPNMRGIRDFDSAGRLTDSKFLHGFGLLEKYDLIAGMNVTWEQMDTVRSLADSHPNIRMVIDHTGGPWGRDPDYLDSWRRGMATVAGADNVWCKISGLGMTDHDWTSDSIRPFVLYCIETFDTERCFFGTNWPVDSLWSGYADVVDAYTEIISDFGADDRERLFVKNAEQLYRI